MKQIPLLKKEYRPYGGSLMTTRKGRKGPRPLDTKNSMHVVLRSTKATGMWSFKTQKNEERISQIISKFAHKYGVQLLSLANVGNHLHLHVRFTNRFTYKPFIRAITSAIAMAVTGVSRWKPYSTLLRERSSQSHRGPETPFEKSSRFWDYRPFTRVVYGFRARLALKDYIEVNRLEGWGMLRPQARFTLAWKRLTFLDDEPPPLRL